MRITKGACGQSIAEFTDAAEFGRHVAAVHPSPTEPHVAQLIDETSHQVVASLLYSPVRRLAGLVVQPGRGV